MPLAPQANSQRNNITSALMNIANPPPRRPQLPAISMAPPMGAAQQLPQQPVMMPGGTPQMAPPGALPQGMPQDPPPGQAGAFPTPPVNPTPASPFTPMASAPGGQTSPQQPQSQTQGF